MTRRKLPIGIQTFRELRERNCYYVDKTPYIRRLLDGGKHYFLSRPRRFGKSLLLDTLKELFEGSEELFAGLYIHQHPAWSERYPVVRLSFGGGNFRQPDLLEPRVMEQLAAAERRLGVVSEYLTAAGRFAYLLEALHRQTGRPVAVLVDEYDKPILDALEEPEVARANRDGTTATAGLVRRRCINPYDVLLLLDSREFKASLVRDRHAGKFLLKTLFQRRVASISLDEMIGTEDLLSEFDLHHIGTERYSCSRPAT